MEKFTTNIIVFQDGLYFNGVKGKRVRRTQHFKDAKIFEEMSERDKLFLKNYEYEIKKVEYSIKFL